MLRYRLNPSLQLTVLLVLGGVAAIYALGCLSVTWLRWGISFGVVGQLGYVLWRDVWLRHSKSCICVEIESERLMLALRNGETVTTRLLESGFVTPWLVVLRLRVETGDEKFYRLLLFSDSLNKDEFRRLRVWLKWGSQVRE